MGEKRLWRMKSKLVPVCVEVMDVNDDGALEVGCWLLLAAAVGCRCWLPLLAAAVGCCCKQRAGTHAAATTPYITRLCHNTSPQVLSAWSGGKVEARSLRDGALLFKDQLPSACAGLVAADYRRVAAALVQPLKT